MLQQVGQACFQGLQVLFVQIGLGNAAMVLKRADGCNDHDRVGLQVGQAALDVQELLRTQVCTEAGLGNAIVAQRHGHAGGHDGVAAMRDIGEGTAMHEGRGAFQGLDQVGLQGVLQQRGHRTFRLQVVGGYGFIVIGVADDDTAQALLQVGDAGCQAEDRHDLACNGDVEAIFAGHAMGASAQAADDVAQLAVVHVDSALPSDAAGVDVQLVAIVDVGVDHRSQQIVCRSDCVEVTGEVQVDVLHGNDLGITAACSAALDAEDGAQGRLAQCHDDVLVQTGKGVCQTDGGSGLTLAGGSGIDRGYQDELSGLMILVAKQVVVDLCLVIAVLFQIAFGNTRLLGDFLDRTRLASLCDFDVSQHATHPFS